jgi:hypothetical protein
MTHERRDKLGKVAFEEFVKQMSGAFSGRSLQISWESRGEENKERWRCIAGATIAAYLGTAPPPGEQDDGD